MRTLMSPVKASGRFDKVVMLQRSLEHANTMVSTISKRLMKASMSERAGGKKIGSLMAELVEWGNRADAMKAEIERLDVE